MRQLADAFCKRDQFTQPIAAFVALEEMLLDRFLIGTLQRGEPVIGENCDIDGIRAFRRPTFVFARHAVTPMQSRSSRMALCRITRTLASDIPRKLATSTLVCSL